MYAAIIPARNEEKNIIATLTTIRRLPMHYIIVVINGCTDQTLHLIQTHTHAIQDLRLHIIYFPEPLGIDIPRAIGALYAQYLHCRGALFVDGDMSGPIGHNLNRLYQTIESGVDVALTNCYPYISDRTKLAQLVLRFRGRLNRELHLFKTLGLATPTHGPHALSARALALLPAEALAIPPLTLYWAQRHQLKIAVATSIKHKDLQSPRRNNRHARMVAKTIIGDCVMALYLAQNQPVSRSLGKHEFLGYHPERRFDLLLRWQNAVTHDPEFLRQHLIRFSE
ncbi:MAG: glycosyltransferase [Peptococcaceae bacterium]|jgi:glycosyltransferase involved in cell wall biosynthesis|nr:glycosyltransferase [Peptococcaceae bacterium]